MLTRKKALVTLLKPNNSSALRIVKFFTIEIEYLYIIEVIFVSQLLEIKTRDYTNAICHAPVYMFNTFTIIVLDDANTTS